jgi:hypothetical protein
MISTGQSAFLRRCKAEPSWLTTGLPAAAPGLPAAPRRARNQRRHDGSGCGEAPFTSKVLVSVYNPVDKLLLIVQLQHRAGVG